MKRRYVGISCNCDAGMRLKQTAKNRYAMVCLGCRKPMAKFVLEKGETAETLKARIQKQINAGRNLDALMRAKGVTDPDANPQDVLTREEINTLIGMAHSTHH
jgi:hypothetical protein